MSMPSSPHGAAGGIRGFEFHSHRIWDRRSIERAMDFMRQVGLNALIFHQTDIIDRLVLPDKFFGQALPLGTWPEFLILKDRLVLENNRNYMNQVIDAAHAKNIQVFFNIKEPWYPEYLLYLYPDLMDRHGKVCPSNPFWWEFVEAKVEQLLKQVPAVDGIIQSPGTIETKVSFSYSSCTCERCQAMTLAEWMKRITLSIQRPLEAQGKRFIVRDFAYFPSEMEAIFDVMKDLPDDVVVSLKCAPHDFYPTFPQNPRIGKTDGHEQWIEFDTWGQYCGLGVFPCILLDDIRERVTYARHNGAAGYTGRTDWEIVTEGWALECFSLINLYGLHKLWEDPTYPKRTIYAEALRLLENTNVPFAGQIKIENEQDLDGVMALLEQTWPILRKSLYIKGHLFQGNSMGAAVDSLREARYTTTEHHNLSIWDVTQPELSAYFTAEGINELLSEKEAALADVRAVVTSLRDKKLGLNRRLNAAMLSLFDAFELYVRQFYHAGRAYVLTEYALKTGQPEDTANAVREVAQLTEIGQAVEAFRPGYLYEPHANLTALLLDAQRIFSLQQSLLAALEQTQTSAVAGPASLEGR